MMTVLIECGAEGGPLGASLATLIAGAVEGLVREVVVLDAGMDAGARKVADHAGCRVEPLTSLRNVVTGAKGDWIMLIEPGARLVPDWIEGVVAHIGDVEAGATPRAARFSPSRRDRPGFLRRLRGRSRALADGMILPKAQGVGLAQAASSLEAMAKGVATTRLEAGIRPRVGGKG